MPKIYYVEIKENDVVVGLEGIPFSEYSYKTNGLRIEKKLVSDNIWENLINLDVVDVSWDDELQFNCMTICSLEDVLKPLGLTVEIKNIDV